MSRLSISTAWDETKAILTHDGKLLASVALALVALPTAVTGLLDPNGVTDSKASIASDLIIIVASLIALSGQLALIRLALGPSITVGGAIAHGIRRVPIYFLAVLLLAVALVVVAIPFAAVLAALGVPIDAASGSMAASPAVIVVILLYAVLAGFVGVRMVMAAPAASAEPIGPIAVLVRSWRLTNGHWWRLFGFLLAFLVGAIALLLALGAALGIIVTMTLGPITPMSASALVMALVQALANAAISTWFAVMLARIYAQLAGLDAQVSVPSSGT